MKLFLAFCLIGTAAAAGRDECPMTCSYSPGGLIEVEHDASSSHTQHRCFVSDEDACECECRESDSHSWIHQDLTAEHCVGAWSNSECSPACDSTCKDTETFSFTTQPNAIGNACAFSDGQTREGTERTGITSQNCVGSWSTTTQCSPACGETCTDTETFSISTEANSCGAACDHEDGDTRAGTERTGDACAVCDASLALAIPSTENTMTKTGDSYCTYESGGRLKMDKGKRTCIWVSHMQNLGAGHNYEKLRIEFDVRERGWQESEDHAKVSLQACETAQGTGCTTMKALHTKSDDVGSNWKGWSEWEVNILSSDHLSILANHQYVRVKVELESTKNWLESSKSAKKEEWMVRNLEIKSECD